MPRKTTKKLKPLAPRCLYDLMDEAGWTTRDAAKNFGCSQGIISQYSTGRAKITTFAHLAILHRFCEILPKWKVRAIVGEDSFV